MGADDEQAFLFCQLKVVLVLLNVDIKILTLILVEKHFAP